MTLRDWYRAWLLRQATRRLMRRHQVALSAALRAYRPGHF